MTCIDMLYGFLLLAACWSKERRIVGGSRRIGCNERYVAKASIDSAVAYFPCTAFAIESRIVKLAKLLVGRARQVKRVNGLNRYLL